jgi:hypothetical protein
LNTYFTGNSCPQGHISNRYTNNGFCVDCRKRFNTDYYENHIDKVYKSVYNWRSNNKEKVKDYNKENSKQWKLDNPLKVREQNAKRKALKIQALPKWANMETIKEIYENCPEGYHVDYIVPLKGKNVCGLHVENNLQYLTKGENLSKGNKF